MFVFRLILHYVFFFNDTATTEIYTLSLHDALPISLDEIEYLCPPEAITTTTAEAQEIPQFFGVLRSLAQENDNFTFVLAGLRSEEHTSELQSRQYLVCRLLLEKKKNNTIQTLTLTH